MQNRVSISSCSVRPTPKTYIISDIYSDFDAVRNAWFQAVKAAPGLEHCYIHEQFRPGKDGAWEHLCYLALEDYAVKKLKLEKLLEAKPSYQFERCVHLVERSETISPGQETVEHMKRWAEENGLSLTGEIHAHYLWNQHSAGKRTSSYIEIDMPIR